MSCWANGTFAPLHRCRRSILADIAFRVQDLLLCRIHKLIDINLPHLNGQRDGTYSRGFRHFRGVVSDGSGRSAGE
jgi:hypothetical protein